MTEKLYYSDSHLFSFQTEVISCEEEKGEYLTVLAATAFFPEGGGQRADTGYIGAARVRDVFEKNGIIYHITDRPLEQGSRAECSIDAEQRLRRMQNHSGEHIVSGTVHNLFGYDNVGFHMGEGLMTIDFSGELSAEDIERVETLANEKVRENAVIRTYFPKSDELADIEYRSKLDLTENVRLVEIEGCDRCACCAPHVSRTGEVGLIKILSFMRHRGGTRIELTCGMDALDAVRAMLGSVRKISAMLSVPADKVSDGVERAIAVQTVQKERIAVLSMENAKLTAESAPYKDGNICLFNNVLDEVALRELINLTMLKCSGISAVFSGNDNEGYRYIIGSSNIDLRSCSKQINAGISGRGGGKPTMISGSCSADRNTIETFISGFAPELK